MGSQIDSEGRLLCSNNFLWIVGLGFNGFCAQLLGLGSVSIGPNYFKSLLLSSHEFRPKYQMTRFDHYDKYDQMATMRMCDIIFNISFVVLNFIIS